MAGRHRSPRTPGPFAGPLAQSLGVIAAGIGLVGVVLALSPGGLGSVGVNDGGSGRTVLTTPTDLGGTSLSWWPPTSTGLPQAPAGSTSPPSEPPAPTTGGPPPAGPTTTTSATTPSAPPTTTSSAPSPSPSPSPTPSPTEPSPSPTKSHGPPTPRPTHTKPGGGGGGEPS